MTCYIIDDEPHAISVLEDHIKRTPGLVLLGAETEPLKGLAAISTAKPPELTFLDVDMPELNGLTLAGMISPLTTVVFTTSYREYAPEAFETDAVAYLLKPISYERFLQCVQKIRLAAAAAIPAPFLLVKSQVKGKLVRIGTGQITYIESKGNYVYFHLTGETVSACLTLAEVMARLPEADFSRVHQSYIVPHQHIRSVEYGQVKLADVVIPIGDKYREAFQQKMNAFVLGAKGA